MIDKRALKKLSRDLPYGCASKIRERIIKKYPELPPFSCDYIRKVLDPDDSRKNTIILDEAINYRDELNAVKADMERRIYNILK